MRRGYGFGRPGWGRMMGRRRFMRGFGRGFGRRYYRRGPGCSCCFMFALPFFVLPFLGLAALVMTHVI